MVAMTISRSGFWTLGALLGASAALLFFLVGVLGVAVAGVVVVGVLVSGHRVAIGTGLLTGIGGLSLILLAIHPPACSTCSEPTLGGWLVGAAVLLVAGVASTAADMRRRSSTA